MPIEEALDEWQKLVTSKAKWEGLLALYKSNGADKVKAELRTVYGLTPGAAEAVTDLLVRLTSEHHVQGKYVYLHDYRNYEYKATKSK